MLGNEESIQTKDQTNNEIRSFLKKYCLQQIVGIKPNSRLPSSGRIQDVQKSSLKRNKICVIEISLLQLGKENARLASLLITKPLAYIDLFVSQAKEIYNQELGENTMEDINEVGTKTAAIPLFKISLTQPMGEGCRLIRDKIPKCEDLDKLLFFKGTCVKSELVKLLETCKSFTCRKCNAPIHQKYDIYSFNQIQNPTKCPGDSNESCNSTKFNPMDTIGQDYSTTCIDYQEIKVQEQVSKLSLGMMPQSITVILREHLVDMVKPGQDVMIACIPFQRWRKEIEGERCDVELCLLANNVFVLENYSKMPKEEVDDDNVYIEEFWSKFSIANLMKGRNLIVSSFCPEVFGMHNIKLALLLVLIGGTPSNLQQKENTKENSSSTRPESHILLIGDPGTAKSQLLRSAAKLSPRAVFTTSTGTSTAGLTVSLSKDSSFNGEWTLEPGALVLADGGVCCIDEFGRCKSQDLSVLHEAMELGSVSVAKAGICCKLSSRVTVLAATNPKPIPASLGKEMKSAGYSSRVSIQSNQIAITHGIASPLLSRFDLIMAVLDQKDEDRDIMISSFILFNEITGKRSMNSSQSEQPPPVFDFDTLKNYLSFCKTFSPELTESASIILKRYYQVQRQTDSTIHSTTISTQPRTTIRLLESLIRLAQAHARFRCNQTVDICDAVTSCLLMESSVLGCLGISTNSMDHCPEDGDLLYQSQEHALLSNLGLLDLISNRVIGIQQSQLNLNLDDLHMAINKTQRSVPQPDNLVDTDEESDDFKESSRSISIDQTKKLQRIERQEELVASSMAATDYSWSATNPFQSNLENNTKSPKQQSPSLQKWDDDISDLDDFHFDDPNLDVPEPRQDKEEDKEELDQTPLIHIGMLGFSGAFHGGPVTNSRPVPLTDDEILDLFTPPNEFDE